MILPLLPEECLRQISYSTDSSLIGIWWQQTESAGVDIEDYYTVSDKTIDLAKKRFMCIVVHKMVLVETTAGHLECSSLTLERCY